MRKLWLFLFAILFINFVSSSGFGYNNPELPNIPSPEEEVTTTTTININNTNISEYWEAGVGTLDDANATQFDSGDGDTLTILESWFTTLWNVIFETKDTDDLTEGTTNLYDNRSWNETNARDLFLWNGTNIDLGIYNIS